MRVYEALTLVNCGNVSEISSCYLFKINFIFKNI